MVWGYREARLRVFDTVALKELGPGMAAPSLEGLRVHDGDAPVP